MPSDVGTCPVTVSASTRRTRWPRATSAAARLVAIIVLPTPPFGLNTSKQLAAVTPVDVVDAALEHGTAAVVDRDRTGYTSPRSATGRTPACTGASQVLVALVTGRLDVQAVERPDVDHENHRDVPPAVVQQRPALDTELEIALDVDIATTMSRLVARTPSSSSTRGRRSDRSRLPSSSATSSRSDGGRRTAMAGWPASDSTISSPTRGRAPRLRRRHRWFR